MTPFQRVSEMNTAFGNPQGFPDKIDLERVRKQCLNIPDEVGELFVALGADAVVTKVAVNSLKAAMRTAEDDLVNITDVRDALADIQVFKDGALHMMGYDGDRDMDDVVDGVMTRFVKDAADLDATIALHASKGVTDVYFEGQFPTMVMKSGSDQPDAPRGKFLKSASYQNTVFRPAP